MAERRQQRADRAIRPALQSPGRPPPRREVEREFWRRIAEGLTSEDAAVAIGVSGPVGRVGFATVAGCHRSVLPSLRAGTCRSPNVRRSPFSKLKTRGCGTLPADSVVTPRRSHGSCVAMPLLAPANAVTEPRWRSGRPSRLPSVPRAPSWPPTTGCATMCKTGCLGRSGIRTGRRFLVHPWRRGKAGTNPTGLIGSGSRAWSPEQISHRLKVDFTEDESMRISHEAIYQALLRARPRRATTRADRVPADRSCPASSPCENSRAGQEVHHRGGNDQPASCGG